MSSPYSGGHPGRLHLTVLGRAGVEQKIRYPDFEVPAVGSTVRVEYQDKHPDQVEIALSGDNRYDISLSNRQEREQHKAGKASRDAAFRAALDAPPGTPPDGDQNL